MDGKLRNMAGVYIIDRDNMLLLYRIGSREVGPSWCNIGGHMEKEELNDTKAGMLRELNEEIGLTECDLSDISLRYVTLRLKNGEIRQNYYFFANLNNHELELSECNEGILKCVEINPIHELEMPFSAKEVLRHYLSIGRYTNNIYTGTATDKQVVFHELNEF